MNIVRFRARSFCARAVVVLCDISSISGAFHVRRRRCWWLWWCATIADAIIAAYMFSASISRRRYNRRVMCACAFFFSLATNTKYNYFHAIQTLPFFLFGVMVCVSLMSCVYDVRWWRCFISWWTVTVITIDFFYYIFMRKCKSITFYIIENISIR